MSQPILIIHGGAGRRFESSKRIAKIRKKISNILKSAYKKLARTNSLEAVTYAVKLLEDDPEFNAGTGSQLQADGHARLSASIMDGVRQRFAGVINVEKIKNPILVARALLEKPDRVLSDEGAFEFAKRLGLKPHDLRTKTALKRWKKRTETKMDTVGACALDRFGNLASATSTGGKGFEMPGRVSDTGMPISNFATLECAVSATGIGEDIMDEGLVIKIATRISDGLNIREAFDKTFREIKRGRKMGAIGISSRGELIWQTTTETLIYGWQKGKRVVLF